MAHLAPQYIFHQGHYFSKDELGLQDLFYIFLLKPVESGDGQYNGTFLGHVILPQGSLMTPKKEGHWLVPYDHFGMTEQSLDFFFSNLIHSRFMDIGPCPFWPVTSTLEWMSSVPRPPFSTSWPLVLTGKRWGWSLKAHGNAIAPKWRVWGHSRVLITVK